MKMNVDSGEILMVCPNDSIPFPYFKTNVNMRNKAKYSKIPCCQKSGSFEIPRNNKYVIEGVSDEEVEEVNEGGFVRPHLPIGDTGGKTRAKQSQTLEYPPDVARNELGMTCNWKRRKKRKKRKVMK